MDLGLNEIFFHWQAGMTNTQSILLIISSNDDRRQNPRIGNSSKGAEPDILTDAPDPPWEGLVTTASIFDMVGKWTCSYGG